MLAVLYLLLPLLGQAKTQARLTQYNETEARILLNLAAGAYSNIPETCINRTLSSDDQWILYNELAAVCDRVSSICSGYILRSDIRREIILVFRGTKTTKQLLTEGWETMQPGINFYDIGKVLKEFPINNYFYNALETLWPSVEPPVKDPLFRNYTVTITGHSLGGALAALCAMKIVHEGLRPGNLLKVVTFGEPRVGDHDFAVKFDEQIPYSFRVVHRVDIVPHLPACVKDKTDLETQLSDSKKCDTNVPQRPYHHGIEIWYPYGMEENAEYVECLGEPKNEDYSCSDGLTFEFSKYDVYVADHRHYFGYKVPLYGKLGCVVLADNPNNTTNASYETQVENSTKPSSVLKKVVKQIQNISKIFGFGK
uniref:Lipase_3 domain-containing protein n=1 Tax=Syphacia muris TaxID=451379 RepID=A0A0N5AHA0_9BILA